MVTSHKKMNWYYYGLPLQQNKGFSFIWQVLRQQLKGNPFSLQQVKLLANKSCMAKVKIGKLN